MRRPLWLKWNELRVLKLWRYAKGLLRWSEDFSQIVWSGIDGIFTATITNDDGKYLLFSVRTEGRFGFRLRLLCVKPAFSDHEVQIEMLRKLNEIPGLRFDRRRFGWKTWLRTRVAI